MAGFVHQGHAAGRFNFRRQALRAFHVKQNRAARYAGQHVAREQHHLPVRVDVLSVLGHDAQPVAIAVKGQTQLSIGVFQRIDQIVQVFRFAGVRMVVGKVAIHFAEQLGYFATQSPKDVRR